MALDPQHIVDSNMAVVLRNARKSYEKGNNPVLDNLNMFVPKGCIYGLLGASGCGKTTLLNVVVGLLKLDAGEVKVLGGTPGMKNSAVPGPRIGYMPQNAALVGEFSVKGAIFYFGWLFGMNQEYLETRFEFLSDLLELPPDKQLIYTLSGGELRRVSLAAALVHVPELLILDEPTVGLDPVLRQNIWDYMIQLATEQGVTILLTTHYIEEAKQANKIGLLRNGSLLAESYPNHLLEHFNSTSLEEVFLTLSQRQMDALTDQPVGNNSHQLSEPNTLPETNLFAIDTNGDHNTKEFPNRPRRSSLRMKALLYKNFLKIFTNKAELFFIFGLPFIQTLAFFLAVGGDPTLLPIGIVNEELGNCYTLPGGITNHSGVHPSQEPFGACYFKGLSCLYIDMLVGGKTINLFFDTLEEALEATKKGHTLSTLYFQKNFSEAMQLRQDDDFHATDSVLNTSSIRIWMDMSDYQIATSLKVHFIETYTELSKYIGKVCYDSEKHKSSSMTFNDPIYGEKKGSFSLFMAPGMILSVIYFMSTSLTATVIIMERMEGVWSRNLVAGVTNTEILLAQLIVQIGAMIIQMAETLVIGFCVFNMHVHGSVFSMLLLLFLQSLCGFSFGLLISTAFDNVTMASYTSLGSFYPYMILSGIMWPLEGMAQFLQYVSLCLPGTWATKALRNILDRGWGITHPEVYPGFVITLAWLVAFVALSAWAMKSSRK